MNVPELEQRFLSLQRQVERLWQLAEGNTRSADQRLAGMADQYAENLQRWVFIAERHARAVTQLESYVREWKDSNSRLQQDASVRFRELEAVIQREWESLRKVHEEPVKELREQAASLTDVCVATAGVAQEGFTRAEARLASFESDIGRRLSEFERDLQAAIAELKARTEPPPARLGATAPWSLDDVTRLHSQVRESEGGRRLDGTADPSDYAGPGARALPGLSGAAAGRAPFAGTSDVDRTLFAGTAPAVPPPVPWRWRMAVAALGLALVVAGVFGWYLQNEVRVVVGRAQAAEVELQRAAADAAQQAAAAREQAAQEISSAREMANRAERIGNVLAAPDLIRYSLSGGTAAPGASGQALWSRTRGFVFSGSRIPPAPPNTTHQVWLLTRVAPVGASTFVPAPDGTVTLVEQGLNVPRPVVGVMVTAERSGGADAPTGEPILTSVSP